MTVASPVGSVHGSHDEVVDRSLRITVERMEQVNRELEAEWQRKRADYYRDEMIRNDEMIEQK